MLRLTQLGQQADARCLVIGHRGAAAVCPENTLPSFLTARDAGADMIELDVQQSADDVLIIFHDDTLDRLCGEATALGALPASVLAAKIIGHWCGQPVTIPSLSQVFGTLGNFLLYNVELKTDTVHYPGIEARLAALVASHKLTPQVLVSSFNYESLRLMRQCDPRLSLGMLLSPEQAKQCGSLQGIITLARELACFSVHPEFSVVRQWPALGTMCHAAGLRLFPWTVDNQADWQFLIDVVGVDGIITNDPGKLHDWLK